MCRKGNVFSTLMPSSRINRLCSFFGLIVLAPFSLSACSPLNTPLPAATAIIVIPTETPGPAPVATVSATPSLVPVAACLSHPGRLVDGVLDTALLAKPMRYHVYLPPCYAEEPQR